MNAVSHPGGLGKAAKTSTQLAVKYRREESEMLATILIVVLVMTLLGVLPRWPHSRSWGYAPTGGVGLILFVIVILLLLGRI